MSELTAVVLAAGRGTRMRSATPKMLHDLCGRALVAWPAGAVQDAGAGRVVVVVSPDIDIAEALPQDAVRVVQQEANGTGGAVVAAREALPDTGTVLVVNGDVPLVDGTALRGLLTAHEAAGAAATVGSAVLDEPGQYGRVVRGADGSVEQIVEAKAEGDATPEQLAIREVNAGVYVFEAAALGEALRLLKPDNAQGELYLTDCVAHLRAAGKPVAAHDLGPEAMLGVNDRVELAAVRAIAQRRILEGHMRAGVTVTDPGSVVVDADVTIGQDATIEPGTTLRAGTSVGARATVGPHTTATASAIGDGARVLHSVLDQAEVGEGASVGPFAYLRPGTVLREGAKAGTFVELKNSDIGAGTKVPHLSYIGDADVGPGTNLGAATITANYDGRTRTKSRTTIGAEVKTAVDTTLVAPVTLGDRAFTAAGSVITDDVEPGALAVARARQKNIQGYADRD
ncbi:bifunctional UDP-N-acetylglucosamine diphosphorylase/glucosamine-1-phosphate N-acetyltransferase GlmU [Conexibacter sp. SYSU D00693]|uniref:bifunctional UDP-N-acetylglucosamine diphosphorylase/glucosamine-1-phosphate N-acetyltransferase GlmU n=1 Tax=Conexibacter sp. SYSU D00693 TaxID=2812560 RepID=UPI001F11A983|nr:bifunctional UDP-N-acetylglucosamine diphosphorylase/glucosamine-1-phosphate N-acetyltransferase GlmU [Conexibacter sp. SYSU D00693]